LPQRQFFSFCVVVFDQAADQPLLIEQAVDDLGEVVIECVVEGGHHAHQPRTGFPIPGQKHAWPQRAGWL
jgi:hypothetical protein